MGKAFVKEALQHYQFVKDPEVADVVNKVGYRIIRAIGANPAGYHFLVVREDQPNAFAIPGGYIFIFDGLLLQIRGEDELAGVLAHEIAHIERNHFFKDEKKIAALDIATIAAILLGGGPAAVTIAGAANIDVRLQFSRENESEADSYALRYIKEGGYSPDGLLYFFDSMIRFERFNPQTVPAYLSTHPGLGERRNRIADFLTRESSKIYDEPDDRGKTEGKSDWLRMITILVSNDRRWKDETALLQLLQPLWQPLWPLRIDEIHEKEREELSNYLLGLAYMKGGRCSEAVPKYLAAIGINNENHIYYADLAFCYLKQQDLGLAREAAVKSLVLQRDYTPAHVILGIIEQDSGNIKEAAAHLEEALRINEKDPMVNFYLAMVYRESGDAAREAFYSARYLRINLNPDSALGELNRAKGFAETGSPLYFRIIQEVEEIRREGL
ncbi:MAG: M48 family metalloprotease [Nitrospirae bacterium]|nr:M48 family metalloprotease [Nitrospirota bacterium]